MRPVRFGWITLVVLLSVSCGRGDEASGEHYELSGRVVSVDEDSNRITIAHDDIPGFMQAMTMPFEVKDTRVFQSASPGDQVQATLVVTDERSWLEDVVITRTLLTDELAKPLSVPGEPNPGDAVPDFTLINQDGRAIHVAQYRGKALALTFIYTRCPLPEYCPRMTSHFAKLEEALEDDPALYEMTHLLMVSFDHEYDSPAVLTEYAGTKIPGHSGSFSHWELATGSEEEVQEIARFFGLTYWPENEQIVHSLRTAVITPDGKLFKLYRGNDWEPSDILGDLKDLVKS